MKVRIGKAKDYYTLRISASPEELVVRIPAEEVERLREEGIPEVVRSPEDLSPWAYRLAWKMCVPRDMQYLSFEELPPDVQQCVLRVGTNLMRRLLE